MNQHIDDAIRDGLLDAPYVGCPLLADKPADFDDFVTRDCAHCKRAIFLPPGLPSDGPVLVCSPCMDDMQNGGRA